MSCEIRATAKTRSLGGTYQQHFADSDKLDRLIMMRWKTTFLSVGISFCLSHWSHGYMILESYSKSSRKIISDFFVKKRSQVSLFQVKWQIYLRCVDIFIRWIKISVIIVQKRPARAGVEKNLCSVVIGYRPPSWQELPCDWSRANRAALSLVKSIWAGEDCCQAAAVAILAGTCGHRSWKSWRRRSSEGPARSDGDPQVTRQSAGDKLRWSNSNSARLRKLQHQFWGENLKLLCGDFNLLKGDLPSVFISWHVTWNS